MSIFSGLENFGLGKLKNSSLYEDEKKNKADKAGREKGVKGAEAQKKPEAQEKDLLFEKSYACPVCDNKFSAKTVRTGKAKLVSSDSDLRPRYKPVDSIKYEAVVCPQCGYAALNRFFDHLLPTQAKMIKEQICSNFKGLPSYGDIYTYDDAIARYKLALANTMVKKAKTSERAYTCLKLAWVIRGKQEEMPKDAKDYDAVMKELKEEEDELIQNAYEGLEAAFSKENFPICGMDESTATYLVADLARRSGHYENANRWISQVITSRSATERVKDKARQEKEMIKHDQEAAEAKGEGAASAES